MKGGGSFGITQFVGKARHQSWLKWNTAIGDFVSETELVAPCGINCARCSAYLAYKHDVSGKGVAMYCCAGCRPKKKRCGHLMKDCSLLRKGQVRFCY